MKLLVAGRVAVSHRDEVLGRERRDRRELDRIVEVQRVADAQVGGVDDADDVAGEGLVEHDAVVAEDLVRVGERERLAAARVRHLHPALEAPRCDAQERDAVAVARVHVRLDLEDEAGERGVDRARRVRRRRRAPSATARACAARRAAGRRRSSRRPSRRRPASPCRSRSRRRRASPPAPSSSSSSSAAVAQASPSRSAACSAFMSSSGARFAPPAVRVKRWNVPVCAVDDAAEVAGDADRPRRRDRREAEHRLDVVEHLERVEAGAVVLVDERDERDVARLRDLEQPQRLRLDALRRVEQHDRAVRGGEHAQRVLGEVLVAGRVEEVEDRALVLEAQDGARHGDPAAALDVHPVRGRRAAGAAALDGAGLVDRVRVEQELLGERRLARVRVRDDRERPPACGLGRHRAHGRGDGHLSRRG